ncbi:ClpP/crotonase [Xylona heveae TC161]|uniref:3-hydroxyisobutyryl-CoA hydrolase n=1 Tax=Xylona heveae (strain CBS 132557 / TC161) TaxID=1328760 RepID=A0A165JUS1_XYLHT|nr:ClpP/crotonase [Xylona heveae TC161]KZF26657.1 ClpP/crotonase [Xylona heveae TC161]
MPLRAKILNPAVGAGQARMVTQATMPIVTIEEEKQDDVLFNTLYGARTIELNRPAKLNSLNSSMARKITLRLKEWEKSQLANVIVIKGAGHKAFCAGGDVATLAKQNTEGPHGQAHSTEYFGHEYRLDHIIATYSKPYVAFMDGVTMGGGVGLSVHAPFRIATERTLFAMPETTIGFFPDVGGSFFLPRLDGEIGTYLALTSERLTGVNAYYAGIATHYVHSSSLPDLEARLAELVFKDYASLQERLRILNTTIEEYVTGLPYDEPMKLASATRAAIDRCFRYDTMEEILAALQEENTEWAQKTIETLHQRSPTSVRVALRQMRLGRQWSIAEAFQREYHIAAKFMEHPDFVEGVSARLIRKPADTPQWQPASLEESTMEATNAFFEVEGADRLALLSPHDFSEYPHSWIGLPPESEVEKLVRDGDKTRNQILEHLILASNGKIGVQEKVQEILERKTSADGAGGRVSWIPEEN